MAASKTITLKDFLSEADIERCVAIGTKVDQIEAEIIKPQMAEINRKLGQKNHSRYLAHAVVYALMASRSTKGSGDSEETS